ncbi:MAG: LEA type 2 family protein [Candidatus Electrothrix sp. YB6]
MYLSVHLSISMLIHISMKVLRKKISVPFAAGLYHSSALLFAALCFTLLPAGCASVQQSLPWGAKEELNVALSDIELQEIKALETIFLLKLRVVNPNDTQMEIRSIKCDLKINGEVFASGISDERKGLPPFGTISVPVVVYTSKFSIVGTVIELLQKDVQQYGNKRNEPLNYELDGQLHLGKDGKKIFPFKVAGKIVLNG